MKNNIFLESFKKVDLKQVKKDANVFLIPDMWQYMKTPQKAIFYFANGLTNSIVKKSIGHQNSINIDYWIVLYFICLYRLKRQYKF